MKCFSTYILKAILCLTVILFLSMEVFSSSLKIVVTNLKSSSAPVMLAVYKKCVPFPDDKAAISYLTVNPTGNKAIAEFDIPDGEYAVAIFQDINKNGKLDTGWFGIPKEPYCFSNNFKPIMSAPKFEDCSFVIKDSPKNLEIKLLH